MVATRVKAEAAISGCRRALRAMAFCLLLACTGMPENSVAAAPTAFLKKGADLQKLLDTTGELWLAPDIDYRSLGGKPLKVPSGAKILSRWNARLPVLVIEGGVHDVWIEGLDGGGGEEPDIVFTGGLPNRNITIIGGNGGRIGIAGRLKVRLEDDSRVEGLDLAEYGALEVLQGTSGYVRHSVFSHALGYRPGSTIWWEGNDDERSADNAFLYIASITPQWRSRWNRAGPLWLVGWDCESWNGSGNGDSNCFEVTNSPSLISMGLSGGTVYTAEGGALANIHQIPLVADFSSRPKGGFRENADLIFDQVGENFHLFRSDIHVVDRRPIGVRSGFFRRQVESLDASKIVDQPSMKMRNLLQSHVFPPLPDATKIGAFASPMTQPVALPTTGLTTPDMDHAMSLQRLIDRDGVARVSPGIYRLARSLRVGTTNRIEGLVASAPGEVVLVAAGNFPLIQGRTIVGRSRTELGQQAIVLSGLALVGGSHGILWSAESANVGPGVKVAHSTFENLRFIGQSVAGVAVLGIEGFDSNSWRRVSFEDMPIALMGVGKGGNFGMNYADKQGFMLCSFRNVRDAVWSWDTERPSGGNFWYRSTFDSVGAVSRTRAAYGLTWFSSTFHDVQAARAIDVLDNGRTETGEFYLISTRWSGRGPNAITDTSSWGQGTYLLGSEFSQQKSRLVGSDAVDMLLSWGNQIGTSIDRVSPDKALVINTVTAGARVGFELVNRKP